MKAFSGLMNPYSFRLLFLVILFSLVSMALLYFGSIGWGLAFLLPAGLLGSGFRILSPGKEKDGKEIPKEVGVLTVLGHRTYIKVEGLTLVCDQFGFDLVGMTVFQIKKEDFKVPVASVRCFGGVRMKGEVSVSGIADDTDDPAGMPNGKTGAEKLWEFHDIGRIKGYKDQIEEICITGLQEVLEKAPAFGQPERNFRWVETHPTQIAFELFEYINAWRPPHDENGLDDSRGLGAKIMKIQVPLTPVDKTVTAADEDAAIELLQREAELRDTETVNRQVDARVKFYTDKGMMNVDAQKCRDEIMFERLAKDKKVTITQGGKLVNLGSVGNTDK